MEEIASVNLQFVRHHHHVAAQCIHQLAGAIGVDLDLSRGAVLANPADGFTLLHTRQFHNPTEGTQVFADLLVTVPVGHLNAAGVGGNADVIGNKNEERIGIRIFAVGFDSPDFLSIGAAAK